MVVIDLVVSTRIVIVVIDVSTVILSGVAITVHF